jgi:hypothetical protein
MQLLAKVFLLIKFLELGAYLDYFSCSRKEKDVNTMVYTLPLFVLFLLLDVTIFT